jgi:hypothetical protein
MDPLEAVSLTSLDLVFFALALLSILMIVRFAFRAFFGKSSTFRETLKALVGDENDSVKIQNAILISHHQESLRQSKLAFTTSIVFASIGACFIFVMVLGETSILSRSGSPSLDGSGLDLSTFVSPVLGGFVIEVVAALFFVQAQRTNRAMTSFLNRNVADKKFEIAEGLIDRIPDTRVQAEMREKLVWRILGGSDLTKVANDQIEELNGSTNSGI